MASFGRSSLLLPKLRPLSNLNTKSIRYNTNYDVAIIGGGIVGCATARELKIRYPEKSIVILEKEKILAKHQSGSNSGVVHAGIYYKPGSARALLCKEGMYSVYDYCDKHKIPYKKCGKLVVATNQEEVTRLDDLIDRATQNKVNFEVVDSNGIRDIEPNCRGIKAISSPDTGIIDFGRVCKHYAKEFEGMGGTVKLDFKTVDITSCTDSSTPDHNVTISSEMNEKINAKHLITCAGLYSDKIAAMTGGDKLPKIVPFRGDYLLLKPEKNHIVKGNIYPVPNPDFPFLGVHFTPRMDGSVWLGPNAFLAFKREGYNLTDFNLREFLDSASFPGLWKLVGKNIKPGIQEIYRYANMAAQVKELQKFIPAPIFTIADVTRGPAGVRAQALNQKGELIEDFIFDEGKGKLANHVINVRNAPSPACTSSMAIARVVADKAATGFGFQKV